MTNLFQFLGQAGLNFFERLGRGNLFILRVIAGVPSLVPQFSLVIAQLYSVGVLSLVIIVVSGLNVGMVLGLQMYNTLVDFGAEASLGPVVALSLVRELGPVVAALLFAGRAGSALTAEIGLMKATEQLSGMEMMAVDPIKRIVAPRFVAGVISMPLLAESSAPWASWADILSGSACWVLMTGHSGHRCRPRWTGMRIF